MIRATRATAALILLVPALTAVADDKTLFIELDSRVSPLPAAVTDNGATIVGNFDGGGGFYWMPTTGAIFTGGLFATDVSADGRTIVGTALDANRVRNAAIWLRAAEWRLLGGFANDSACDTSLSDATGTSRDGKVVVGCHASCDTCHPDRGRSRRAIGCAGTILGAIRGCRLRPVSGSRSPGA